MKNITFTSTISITGRKRDKNGKLIYNTLNRDLKIEVGDVIFVTFQPCLCIGGFAPNIIATNNRNNLTKPTDANQFVYMLNNAFEFGEI